MTTFISNLDDGACFRRRTRFIVPAFLILGLTAAGWTANGQNCPAINFGPTPYPAHTSPLPTVLSTYGSATADFNRDGKQDVIFVGNPDLVTFLGDGRGGFGSSSNVNLGLVASVAVADFNHDAKLDLVCGLSTPNVLVALGRGDGTFGSQVTYSASASGTGTAAVATTADFDGDGNEDVAVLLIGVGVSVMPGRGDGTFDPPRNSLLATANRGIAVADLNGDGFPDIVCMSGNTSVSAFINRGNGTFFSPTNTTFPISSIYLSDPRAGDFDGDGFPDLALMTVVDSAKTEEVILHGTGDGGFTLRQEIPTTFTPLYSSTVRDVNGDGRLDIVLAAYTAVVVLEGLGDGSFAAPIYFTGVSALNVTSGDYNKDGRSDFAVFSAGTSTTMKVMLNTTEFLGAVPELRWIRQGKLSRLVWYTKYSDFALEYRPSLAPSDSWGTAPGSYAAIDCRNYYTISTNPPGFYRLHRP